MLSLFPQILFLSPLGLSLIRIAAGLTLLSLAYYHGSRIGELSAIRFPIIGRGSWVVWIAALAETILAAALIAGYLTQLAALLAALYMLKHLVWQRRYPQFFPLSHTAAFLLLAITLCILVSGAGAFALDLPL